MQTLPQISFDGYDDGLDIFYEYAKSPEIDAGLWISNPSFILLADKRADELIYYPLYNSTKAIELRKRIQSAKHILINTCDLLPCPPWDDSCYPETENMIKEFRQKFELAHYEKSGGCEYSIFRQKK